MRFIFSLLLICYVVPAFGGARYFYSYLTEINSTTLRVYQHNMPSADEINSNPCLIISGDSVRMLGMVFEDSWYTHTHIYGPFENLSPRTKDQNCVPEYLQIYLPNLQEDPNLEALLGPTDDEDVPDSTED